MTDNTPEQAQDEMSLMYQRARMEWDERIGDTVHQLKTWRIIAILSLTVAAFAVMGVGYIGAQSKIQPYALAISDNKVIALQQLDHLPDSEREMVTRSLISGFIENVRSVYSDPFAQQKATIDAFAHLRSNDTAYGQISHYLGKTHIPVVRAESELVTVKVQSVLPLGNGNSYQVEWTETIIDRKGTLQSTPRFRAVVTAINQTPNSQQGFMSNPTGLWITTYQVTEIN
ncbi:conjugal transfer protein TrbF [Shewanella sairae]|uniref:Conjugal transfer protein TrbF n=1 Tax=Shewanella sairae TaxID=190310 RepID=A0ABQ4PRH0_9GAMM|nr:VirB8/TrbF family protein [Shewanella sairae]MCL1132515.1 conjugal transfer protein TrbF [Shewanella sairae]GIU52222.1 conjugal transfer protein TrbF [Shewanella sairae]